MIPSSQFLPKDLLAQHNLIDGGIPGILEMVSGKTYLINLVG